MPFVEIHLNPKGWVRIRDKGITISKYLRDKYLETRKVKIYYDKENKLLGLKASNEGHKVDSRRSVWCKKINVKLDVDLGTFNADWNEKHQMIIVDLNNDITI